MPLERLSPRDLPAALAALEAAAAGAREAAELARLAVPAVLGDLFRLALGRAVRRGPGREPEPARLVEAAARAAGAGAVPLAVPAALRARLERLGRRLVEEGYLRPDARPWWQPLPPPGGLERAWRRLEEREARLPDEERLAAAFGAAGGPRALVVPELLDPALAARAAAELAAADGAAALALAPGGVGADDRRSERRTDSVVYLDGTEPALLAAAPEVAVLVQWLLGPGARRLAAAAGAGGAELHPPQRAMLARFRGPAEGFAPHLDNPGGAADNGRAATLVLYLTDPAAPPAGGEIALWAPGARPEDPPARVAPPAGGTAALFDSRRVLHQVRPLAAGPDRWALTVWLSDRPRGPAPLGGDAPEPTPADALAAPAALPADGLPPGRVLVHEVAGRPPGRFPLWTVPGPEAGPRPRAGVVATVRGAGERLDAWVRHHLELGFARLVVVFDRPDEPAEAAALERLRRRFSGDPVTLWRGDAVAARWPRGGDAETLRRLAGGDGAAWAVAARQALNADVALAAAAGAAATPAGLAPTGELDWLLHLDADELFRLEGGARGGATLGEHFAAAAAAGRRRLRYADHEILGPPAAGAAARFKLNPRLAEARLGRGGFRALVDHLGARQDAPRPYFRAYANGKSAVAVAAAGGAAGVHGWRLAADGEANGEGESDPLLAGPSVLHLHLPDPAALAAKYRAMAAAPPLPAAGRPFPPSALEEAACALVSSARAEGATEEEIDRRLEELWRTVTIFDAAEVELLEEAGLLFEAVVDPVWFEVVRFPSSP